MSSATRDRAAGVPTGIDLAEAWRLVLDEVPLLPREVVSIREALGRVLAEAVVSGRTLPPADCSAMDGYAVRADDAAEDGPVELAVAFEVAAGGRAPRPLAPGEAVRILTGAPLPEGADAVVRQEEVEREGDRIRVRGPVARGRDIRPAGEDVKAGDRVLDPGTRLLPAHVGFLASLGRTLVSVRRRPRVALVSGGDELVEPDRDASGGRIVSSNSYSLHAQCLEAGAEPSYLGIARDRPEELEARLAEGLTADVLVSSAGVSVGDRDFVRPVLEKLGCRIHFHGVKIKPGYPVLFGRFPPPGPLVFGLPGNPVSAMVTFECLVRPALLRMQGVGRCFRPLVRAELSHDLEKGAGRLHLVRVQLDRGASGILATATGSQSSGVLRSMTLAQGLLVVPAEVTRLRRGERAPVWVIDPDFLAEAGPEG